MISRLDAPPEAEVTTWMTERIREATGGLHLISLGAVAIVGLLLYAEHPGPLVLAWAVFLALAQLALELGRRYFYSPDINWLRFYGGIHLATCVGWGIMPLWFLGKLPEAYQYMYTLILTAVAITSLAALAHAPRLYAARTAMLLAPMLMFHLVYAVDDPVSRHGALALFLAMAFPLLTWRALMLYRNYRRTALDALSVHQAHRLLEEKQAALKAAEDRARTAHDWDPVTGVRSQQGLQRLLDAETGNQAGAVVVCLKLIGFKYINMAFSHEAGNEVLTDVASRLVRLSGSNDLVCRSGGGEFLVYLTAPSARVRRDLGGLLERPCFTTRGRISVRANVGVGVVSEGDTPRDALQCAVAAAREARQSGTRDLVILHTAEFAGRRDRSMMQFELGEALARDEFSLAYQPQYLADGTLVGFEALLRWHSPTFGDVSPGVFIPIAEETGLINEVGDWVLDHALSEFRRFPDAENLTLSVNVSLSQLEEDGFVERVQDILVARDVPAHQLVLEVTESTFMAAPELIRRRLEALRDMRVLVALDDFGTGYSSLSYLTRIPLDHVKIDRSLISDITGAGIARTLVESVLDICRALDVRIVIEGLETAEQLTLLEQHRNLIFQGYYFSPPLPLDQARPLARQRVMP
jgi:diguanylate cyclase (GGDEF)-like protein